MSDHEIGKRKIEREHLELFLKAYKVATGEVFSDLDDCETPDFIGYDENERIVGIEITALRFAPDERHWRHIFTPGPDDIESWRRLLVLMQKKKGTLLKGVGRSASEKSLSS